MSAPLPESPLPESPFSARALLALVVLGAGVFAVLLWMIGAGMTAANINNGGGHAGGRGLNGYAAFARLLEQRGMPVQLTRSAARLDDAGLLVLTPPQDFSGAELELIVSARRRIGPTLVITPKWLASPADSKSGAAKPGWVELQGTSAPDWPGFLDDVRVQISPMRGGGAWVGKGFGGPLPIGAAVASGQGRALVPLVAGQGDGRILAAYLNDGGIYPDLAAMALRRPDMADDDDGLFPLVVVFEPDLLDNYGMAHPANARLAAALVQATLGKQGRAGAVTFDLTANGLGRSPNLLTLAFAPPFLAATLCLLLAALAVGWRAFLRFGPPRAGMRAIAFGKAALVANTAGLLRRTGRLHLVGPPYADHVRERIARALALPRLSDAAATEAAIDRVVAARDPAALPFSASAARLRRARRPHAMLAAARELHSLERMLTK